MRDSDKKFSKFMNKASRKATDLRMKTGHIGYAFKFALAEKDIDGWKEISPLRL